MFCFLLLSALLVVATSAGVCEDGLARAPAGYVNGCSTPLHLPFFFKTLFTPTCNKHDICYHCGAQYGRDRAYCDQMFYDRLKAVCDHVTKRFLVNGQSAKIAECKAAAWTYYEAVHVAGGLVFRTQPASYCSESWIQSCI